MNRNLNKEVIEWGRNYLLLHGYKLKNILPENVQATPWSNVIRFATVDGYIYLKQTPALLGLEAPIIQILRDQFHAPVPLVIAHNAELNCFLMKDAGKSLRLILKGKFDEALLHKAIDQFTSLQLSVADHVDVFLNIGVPDWRLDKLPALYQQLLSQTELLIADGLSEIDIDKLKALLPEVYNLCEKLSSYSIKQSIVQPDFNDNNTLIADTSMDITIIDLGEIAISHPFFSLLNCLHVIKKYYALTEKDNIYIRTKAACLKNYMTGESNEHLLTAFETARILFFIYAALCSYRLMIACDQSEVTVSFQRHFRPSVSLKEFIMTMGKL